MNVYDAVIVGAGPAGSSAAYDLASAGANVLIVDKEHFPRDKTCGGGLTAKTLKALRFDVSAVVSQECDSVALTNRLRQPVKETAPGTLVYMTNRRQFDQFCLDQAISAGAEFSMARITDVQKNSENSVTLRALDGRVMESRFVIAADGAKSAIRRIVLPADRLLYAFALEGKTAIPAGRDGRRMDFDFFMLPHGYGWVFPKDGYLNVGIGSFRGKGGHGSVISKKALMDYCQKKFGHTDISDIAGHPLGGGGYSAGISCGRILFAGDAAGTVESLLGEGIYNAVVSGQAAAASILEALKHENDPLVCAASYEKGFDAIRRELALHRGLGAGFYGFSALSYMLLRIAPLRSRLLERLAKGKAPITARI